VDVVALVAVISSAVVGLTGSGAAFWSAQRTARTAREEREQKRLAEAYLKVLSYVEAEAHWLDTSVYNFGWDSEILEYGAIAPKTVPKPNAVDRVTTAALVAAFGSKRVRSAYEKWREAADTFETKVENICVGANLNAERDVAESDLKELREHFQPTERAARQSLAEAVAAELGHLPRERRVPRLQRQLPR
jgi:membrane-associated HD superfamily phosphohydrolase